MVRTRLGLHNVLAEIAPALAALLVEGVNAQLFVQRDKYLDRYKYSGWKSTRQRGFESLRKLKAYLAAAHVRFNGGRPSDHPLIISDFAQVASLLPRAIRAAHAGTLRACGYAWWLDPTSPATSPEDNDGNSSASPTRSRTRCRPTRARTVRRARRRAMRPRR